MALSKPIYSLMEKYFEQLYTHPIRTKSINSCVIAVLGNLAFQYLSGNKVLNQDSLIAYGLYGLLFGGTIPHFFYKGLDGFIPYGTSHRSLKQLAVERFIFMPLYQAFSLYMLARLEGKSHNEAIGQLLRIYGPTVRANWIWLTVVQYLNLRLVPPMLRVLFANLIGFFWIIYLAKRRQARERKGNKQ
ncbi:peroxisomal membrane protein 2 isoform X2 [Schistocerca gregaria]|nr:peroxisomal membrane protein 2 isoform X2 [Schistocerca gregaria]XP_049859988.1 peroxisomal membrane protein 2 isoform X2 [Schistocerca gregaria]XP_049859997.1 peroxisomal membrane protein 2 isoform X2 [Schistocerca gregaria]XP_049860004.1 peroxisomal membrane protein 2 isoform X2 [Schistocerca gregaria]